VINCGLIIVVFGVVIHRSVSIQRQPGVSSPEQDQAAWKTVRLSLNLSNKTKVLWLRF